jgi:hypothetical protein
MVKQSVCTLGPLSTNRRTQEITNGLCSVILQQYSVVGQELLEHIVTGDETWIHHHNLEIKLASTEWKICCSLQLNELKILKSTDKVMAAMF